MSKPIIGIAGEVYTENKPLFIGDSFDYNNNNYSKSIVKAGGIPIYLPVVNDISVLEEQLSICNGLLLPGGVDINPLLYNELPKPSLGNCNDLVDWYQINLTKKSFDLNIPILGICRGIQVLNVAAGGTLYQDISLAAKHPLLHKQNSYLGEKCHTIYIYNDSIINNILGNKYIVNSGHHQCVNEIAASFKKTSMAPDGIIESIEMIGNNFVVGVQWHPEMMALKDDTMLNLFKTFICSCIK